MNTIKHLAAGALLALGAASAHAGVIDFEDIPSGDCYYLYDADPLQSGGYNFTGNASGALWSCGAGVLQSNTSNALINANTSSVLTMSQIGGGAFSLAGFWAGARTEDRRPDLPLSDFATAIRIDGALFGGGSVSYTVTLGTTAPYSWIDYVLPNLFGNLTSVTFSALGDGAMPQFLIDDIRVGDPRAGEPPATVPEPGSLLLLGAGLAAAFAARRTVRSKHA